MLTGDDNQSLERLNVSSSPVETRVSKMMSFEWIGQTLASLCWIISVFVYGISSTGDWLQLMAASSWMLSNIASIFVIK
ncbi:MAG: hypothetical protein BD935_04140 [Marine Group III euryarchaeote CG-Epi1]|jgi:hypothetical protein|uniref:Uncharacterized protein n=1 Tax=Marine Group III euryarchaeote CG-Epi1 TaxID=1888995 RepID=A0A1J5TX69_9ARCH|nr:MAG: hypothetical protein BD935_04140 [Marine Group III euryarchaeote CG-Epi1]